MKFVVVLACVLVAAIAEQYTDKYDNIDLKEILENDRLLSAYVDCLLEKGKCTPEGKELKSNMHDALTNNCEKCTDKQKEGVETVSKYLIENKLDVWNTVADKYDPTGEFRKKYEDLAKEKGITLPKN